jgi:hypothetical protein
MAKTEACRRGALAALLAWTIAAAAPEARSEGQERNDPDLNGFAGAGTFSNGDSSDGTKIVVRGPVTPDPKPDPKRASNPDGVIQPRVTPVPQRRRPGLAPAAPGGQGGGLP